MPLKSPHPGLVPVATSQRWVSPLVEPALCDVLADPLVHLVMRRDGVSHQQLRAVVVAARAKLALARRGADPCPCLAA